ncbi:MAG: bifunctional glycosyltransferase/class I SAM-dependent methyltransferase [Alphaproteobacteria bacterium]|nr:bifunctional glycosyltransferase/class I SAM-dependent methyltransferase [Alphaproteobacteria bacterium]
MAEPARKKPRVLIFIVAYNAEKTIQSVLRRIPEALQSCETEVLIIDDASQDRTFEKGRETHDASELPFKLTVLFNPVNQGYGGNQKIGFQYAIENGFDYVALLHGDGQYAPECLPELLQPLLDGEAEAVFGSRMLTRGGARKGGMPLYKFVGNKVLTTYQNLMLGSALSEFHSGYRIYSVAALKAVPFHLNTNVFHFDTEIIIQFLFAGHRIRELPIPTYYGDEICHVDGLRYAWDVVWATFVARAQGWGVFYRRNFDVRPEGFEHYTPKLGFPSPHSFAVERVAPGQRVLDIGCASGYVSRALHEKGCRVTGIDAYPVDPKTAGLDRFIQHDLNAKALPVELADFDVVLMLDVIEHLKYPERFVESLAQAAKTSPEVTLLVSSGNIGFAMARLMLLLGQFNYGKRGILDLDHTRLFTFASLRRMFEQAGFSVTEVRGVPAPFPLALGENWFARAVLGLNQLLIRLSKTLFSYQMFMVVRPLPSLSYLLGTAHRESAARAGRMPARDAAE